MVYNGNIGPLWRRLAKLNPARRVNTFMLQRWHLVLMLSVAAMGLLAVGGPSGQKQWAWAQDSSRDSRSEGDNGSPRDERRRRFRGDEERRGEERPSRGSTSSSSSGTGSSPATTTSTAKPAGSAAPSMNMSDYAKSLVKQYDKNGNMMLEADERKELRGRAAEADLDKDNVITIDELVAHLSAGAPAAPSSSATSSTSGSTNSAGGSESSGDRDRSSGFRRRDGDASSSDRSKGDAVAASKRVLTGSASGSSTSGKEGDKRRSYRFSRAADRLPKGLPSFFSRDTNGDGQISMSEYSRSWTKNSVADFRRYDKNDDGIITAKEATAKP